MICKESAAPNHPNLRVRKGLLGSKQYKTRQVYEYRSVHKGLDYNVFNSDINSLEAAVKERVFYVKDREGKFVRPTQPKPLIFEQRMKRVNTLLNEYVQYVSPLTKEQFLGAYEGRRRTIYSKAFDSLLVEPLSKKDAVIDYFMKVEKLNFTAKPNSVPRGISPRNPRYHVSLGPFIKRIEKPLFNILDKIWGSKTIFKGLNADQRGRECLRKWNRFRQPIAIGLDAKRFDQHVSAQALQFEHSIYLKFFQKHYKKKLGRMLAWQVKNIGRGRCQDGNLSFWINGMRGSGDMNTALGNCTLMALMIYTFKEHVQLDCELMNDGDDCVLILDKRDMSKLESLYEYMLDYGFDVELEKPVTELEHIEFCQSKPVMVSSNSCRMVRNAATTFSKDAVSIMPLRDEKTARKWTRAVGLCGLSLTSGIPVAQNFYAMFARSCSQAMKIGDTYKMGMHMLAKGMVGKEVVKPSVEARLSYWKAFGVEPDVQELQEQLFDRTDLQHIAQPHLENLQSPLILAL